MKRYKFYSIVTGLFVAGLLISNVLDTKLFMLFGLALPSGILLFPITYVFGDVLTEVYGYAAARKVIWTGFASLILMVFFLKLAEIIPPAPFWEHQEAFTTILGKIPRIALASIIAFFCGEFANSFTLAKMKVNTSGRGMGARFVVSTFVGQAVDTTVFVLIAFFGQVGGKDLFVIIVSAWAFKVVWEILVLPISIPLVKWLKRQENEDYYDRDTNFSPFQLKK